MSRVAVALVTHDGERWIDGVLASIDAQTRQPDAIVVVDDRSTDRTLAVLAERGITPVPAETTLADPRARTGANFAQAARIAMERGCQLVALGDQDDTWHPHRLAHQAWLMDERPHLAMLASDGRLVDEHGAPTADAQGRTALRGAFPLPAGWWGLTPPQRMTAALKASLATGGASMIRPARLDWALAVPSGWLHDRWWSLAAVAMDAFQADGEQVIDYRLSAGQQVGLDAGSQQGGALDRLLEAAGSPLRLWSRMGDVQALRSLAAPGIDETLTSVSVLRGFISG